MRHRWRVAAERRMLAAIIVVHEEHAERCPRNVPPVPEQRIAIGRRVGT